MTTKTNHRNRPRVGRQQLWKAIGGRFGGRFMIGAESDGQLWATNGIWMLRMPVPEVADLLAEFNLEPEPMTCHVGRTIVRTSITGPNITGLLSRNAVPTGHLERWEIGGSQVFLGGPGFAAFTTATNKLAFNRQYVDVIEALTIGHAWRHDGDIHKPAARVDDAGRLSALVMPVRVSDLFHNLNDEALAA